MSAPEPSGTQVAQFDQRAAFLVFDALEKVIVRAVAEEEFEVAAEYVDALFLLADQLDEFHSEFCRESAHLAERDAEIEREQEAIETAICGVASWAQTNDHPVIEWFEGGGSA